MNDDNIIYIGGILGNLTMKIAKTTLIIERIQQLFTDDRIVIEEKYGEDFVLAVGKLFAAINKCERGENQQ